MPTIVAIVASRNSAPPQWKSDKYSPGHNDQRCNSPCTRTDDDDGMYWWWLWWELQRLHATKCCYQWSSRNKSTGNRRTQTASVDCVLTPRCRCYCRCWHSLPLQPARLHTDINSQHFIVYFHHLISIKNCSHFIMWDFILMGLNSSGATRGGGGPPRVTPSRGDTRRKKNFCRLIDWLPTNSVKALKEHTQKHI